MALALTLSFLATLAFYLRELGRNIEVIPALHTPNMWEFCLVHLWVAEIIVFTWVQIICFLRYRLIVCPRRRACVRVCNRHEHTHGAATAGVVC